MSRDPVHAGDSIVDDRQGPFIGDDFGKVVLTDL
jgi:hypothetical protein